MVQKVTFLGNTDNVNFGWFAYDSTDGHPKKCYPILNHAEFLADAARRQLVIDGDTGAELDKIAADIASASKELIAAAASAMK